MKMTDKNLEIYRQRYETFRHFDKLRWQMLQILVAVASATAFILRSTSGPIEWWFLSLLGLALIIVGSVMLRIGVGIKANAMVLKKAAEEIGDSDCPGPLSQKKSVAHWLAVLVVSLGVLIFVSSAWMAVS